MNRAHNHHADSALFVHQRYEDTALVIFQQQAKKKKESKKSLSQQHQTLPYQLAPPGQQHQQQLPPGGKGRAPISSPELNSSVTTGSAANSILGNSSPQHHHSLSAGSSSPRSVSPSARTRTPLHSGQFPEDGLASGGAVAASSQASLLSSRLDGDVAVTKLSDIISSHPLSNIEPVEGYGGGGGGSVVDSPLQSSTHSDVTNPTSENTANSRSAEDLLTSDAESDTAVKLDDSDEEEDARVSECDAKQGPSDGVLRPEHEAAKDNANHPLVEKQAKLDEEATQTLQEEVQAGDKVARSLSEDEVKQSLSEKEANVSSVEEQVKQTFPGEDTEHSIVAEVKDSSAERKEDASSQDAKTPTVASPKQEHKDPVPEDKGENTSPLLTPSPTTNLAGDTQEDRHTTDAGGTLSDLPEEKPTHADKDEKRERSKDVTSKSKRLSGSSTSEGVKPAERSRVEGGRVSGVEFAHYGSSGVVARRKVAMSKSDHAKTQSRVCVVM